MKVPLVNITVLLTIIGALYAFILYVLLNNHILGWIKSQDPYGWFQWYCRFYLGRRTKDDLRQIGRWKSFDGRFKKNLINRINKANTKYNDYTISPAIRQSLLHWGIEVTERDVK